MGTTEIDVRAALAFVWTEMRRVEQQALERDVPEVAAICRAVVAEQDGIAARLKVEGIGWAWGGAMTTAPVPAVWNRVDIEDLDPIVRAELLADYYG